MIFLDTCFVPGDGTGGEEKKLANKATREECMTLVKTREPTANGATFRGWFDSGWCYAEFNMTNRRFPWVEWQTCKFKGIIISKHS